MYYGKKSNPKKEKYSHLGKKGARGRNSGIQHCGKGEM
jgi:hypothetical protein